MCWVYTGRRARGFASKPSSRAVGCHPDTDLFGDDGSANEISDFLMDANKILKVGSELGVRLHELSDGGPER